ncbi:MAG TPA: TonB family protein [Polyangia bacterium]|jgi:TonB family protein|nr:TonB family protein [Polyangia bacterium]
MARETIRRGSRRNFAGLLITAAIHGVVFLAVARAHNQPEAPFIVRHDFVLAEMVKLGKPRDPFWLPRITQPPRPTAPPDQIKLSEDPDAKAAPKEAPRPEDPKISKELKNALERAKKLEALAAPDDDEGSLTGSKLGTANHATGDQYDAQVVGLLRANYNLPAGLTPDQVPIPPEITFHIAPDGTIGDVKLAKSSANSFVDDACVDAAKLTGKVPPPPPTRHGMRIQCIK